jgi:hypothetical protein
MKRAYQLVIEQIPAALERGWSPWRQPWDGPDDAPPNLQLVEPTEGVNAMLLQAARTRQRCYSPCLYRLRTGGDELPATLGTATPRLDSATSRQRGPLLLPPI